MMNQQLQIPQLTKHNFSQWKSIVQKAAIIAGVQDHLAQDVQPQPNESADQRTQREKEQAQASILIEQSISTEVAVLLGPTYHNDSPHQLLTRIQQALIKTDRETRKQLQSEAQSLKYTDDTSIEK